MTDYNWCCKMLEDSDDVHHYVGWHKYDKKWLIVGYDDPDGEEIFYCPFCGKKLGVPNDEKK